MSPEATDHHSERTAPSAEAMIERFGSRLPPELKSEFVSAMGNLDEARQWIRDETAVLFDNVIFDAGGKSDKVRPELEEDLETGVESIKGHTSASDHSAVIMGALGRWEAAHGEFEKAADRNIATKLLVGHYQDQLAAAKDGAKAAGRTFIESLEPAGEEAVLEPVRDQIVAEAAKRFEQNLAHRLKELDDLTKKGLKTPEAKDKAAQLIVSIRSQLQVDPDAELGDMYVAIVKNRIEESGLVAETYDPKTLKGQIAGILEQARATFQASMTPGQIDAFVESALLPELERQRAQREAAAESERTERHERDAIDARNRQAVMSAVSTAEDAPDTPLREVRENFARIALEGLGVAPDEAAHRVRVRAGSRPTLDRAEPIIRSTMRAMPSSETEPFAGIREQAGRVTLGAIGVDNDTIEARIAEQRKSPEDRSQEQREHRARTSLTSAIESLRADGRSDKEIREALRKKLLPDPEKPDDKVTDPLAEEKLRLIDEMIPEPKRPTHGLLSRIFKRRR